MANCSIWAAVTVLVPNAMQLASGWLKPIQYLKLMWMVVLGPLMIWLTHRSGAIGAAGALVIMQGTTTFVFGAFMINKVLKGEQYKYLWNDIVLPLCVCSILVVTASRLHPIWGAFSINVVI